MRIGMLVDAYKPYVSGVTNYIDLNKRSLEAKGHDVFIFTFGDEDYDDAAEGEANVVRSPGLPLVDTGFYLSVRYSRQAQKLLRSMDIVHVHHPFLSGRLALWYCKPRGIPIVFTNHTRYDLYAKAYFPVLPEGMGGTFLKAFLPGFCDSVDAVVAPSSGLKDVLQGYGVNATIDVVPNGVDIKPFQADLDPIDLGKCDFPEDCVVFTYAGRLGPEKNLPFLLRAFSGAAQAYENLCLLIVGDGQERETLEALAHHLPVTDRIHFTGMVDYQTIPAYLAASDIFVTASVTEVHPLSVIEAMAAGLPVLGIESPGVADTVKNEIDGYVVPEQDIAAFTAKMVRLGVDKEMRESMKTAARQNSQRYAIERTTELMMDLYDRVYRNSSPKRRNIRARWIRFRDQWRRL